MSRAAYVSKPPTGTPHGTDVTPANAPGLVARLRRLFGRAEARRRRLTTEISLDPEEWLEYHNPTLGLYRGEEEPEA